MLINLPHPLILGSGVAGLSVALGVGEVTVLTRDRLGSTGYAQGGIAAALGPDDTPYLHAEDTLDVAAGIGVAEAVEVLTEGGPEAVQQLIAAGARFDRGGHGELDMGREGGHGRRRVVHTGGDATGRELVRVLEERVSNDPRIEVKEGWSAIDFIREEERVVGVLAISPTGDRVTLLAPAVVLATGGYGRLFRRTTNPPGVTGEGVSMAIRAGVRLADMEFVQFHPTAFWADLDPMPLLTEALRGEGAVLIDSAGKRFMPTYHPDAELAPRDVVARAIWWQHDRGQGAFLDCRPVPSLADRFQTVAGYARAVGLDITSDPLPVSPAAHYSIGGVDTDTHGRTSREGLWAVGEVSATGVHGANRLGSNSLLEGLVFGARVAADLRDYPPPSYSGQIIPYGSLDLPEQGKADDDWVRELMWERVGLIRTGSGLWEARNRIADALTELNRSLTGRSLAGLAAQVVSAALRRTESRGGHYRADYPETDVFQAQRVMVVPPPHPTVSLPVAS